MVYWYKALSNYWNIPLILFDTPYNFEEISKSDIRYMVNQIEEMIPLLERISGIKYKESKFREVMMLGKETSVTWGEVLAGGKRQGDAVALQRKIRSLRQERQRL